MMKYLAACAAASLSLVTTAFGCELQVADPWIREAPPGATALAGYMVLNNTGSTDCIVTHARADGFGGAMLHRTEQKDGMAHMMHLDRVPIPVGESVVFEPNGLHIMLMQPEQPLQQGDRVNVTLMLEGMEGREIEFPVRRSQ